MKQADQARAEARRLHPFIKNVEPAAVITMIVPGRRALGEHWSLVTIGHDGHDLTVERQAAEAPADLRPIVAVSGPDAEYTRYILEAQVEKAQQRAATVDELSHRERHEAINAAWQAYVEDKLRWLRGQTTIGPGGMQQRQRVYQNPDTRPAHH